tara:strand:+ start:186 stop:344 length:159 start_codon:yes stop_codon:yes gene_type:complete
MTKGGKRKRQRRRAKYMHEKALAERQEKKPEKWVILDADQEAALIKLHCCVA